MTSQHPAGRSSEDIPGRTPERDVEAEHRAHVHGANPAIAVISYLLAGPLTFGLIGWGIDRWLGTSLLMLVGIFLGMGLAGYVIWLRYGKA